MVLISVSAGDVKLRAVMLCNVMMDQMFLDGMDWYKILKERKEIEMSVLSGCSCAFSKKVMLSRYI